MSYTSGQRPQDRTHRTHLHYPVQIRERATHTNLIPSTNRNCLNSIFYIFLQILIFLAAAHSKIFFYSQWKQVFPWIHSKTNHFYDNRNPTEDFSMKRIQFFPWNDKSKSNLFIDRIDRTSLTSMVCSSIFLLITSDILSPDRTNWMLCFFNRFTAIMKSVCTSLYVII